jgi:hypothetical protein
VDEQMSLAAHKVRASIAVLDMSPTGASGATATLATWYVPDLDQVVDELASNGLSFDHYDDPVLKTNEKGIHEMTDGRVAWFKDPDGNAFAIEEGTA